MVSLNLQQVQAYKDQGFLNALDVVTAASADDYRSKFDALEAKVGQEKAQIGLVDYHFEEEFIWELATQAIILDSVEALIGPNVLLLATHFFCKYGEGPLDAGSTKEDTKFVAWHQDTRYWGLEPPLAITAWYAVDDSDLENGCMRVISGTHHKGLVEHGKAEQGGNLLSINQEVPVTAEQEASAVDLILKAGQMSLHDGYLIHGSLPNQSYRRRCGLTLRYVPTWIKQTEDNSMGSRWRAVLVRGENKEQNFDAVAAPF